MFDFNFCSRYIIEYILPAYVFFFSFENKNEHCSCFTAVIGPQEHCIRVWSLYVRSWLDAWPDSYSYGLNPEYVFFFLLTLSLRLCLWCKEAMPAVN